MCAGCDIQVTEDDVNDPENVEGKLGDLQEAFQEVGVITPMVIINANAWPAKYLRLPPNLSSKE